MTENLRTFVAKYVPQTDTKPSRVLINDLRFRKSVVISYHASKETATEKVAAEYLEKRGIKIEFFSEAKGYMMLHSKNFTDQIKIGI